MSSVALTHKFAKTFPKRGVWYGGFFKPQKARSHVFAYTLLVPVAFAFGMLLALDVALIGEEASQSVAMAPSQLQLPGVSPESPLTASVAAATALLHVPGAYVDTSAAPPAIEAPQFVVTNQDVADAASALPYLPQSLTDTVSSDWDRTFGLEGQVFVASVNEFGAQGAGGVESELNIQKAWNEYIDGLSSLLEPYVAN